MPDDCQEAEDLALQLIHKARAKGIEVQPLPGQLWRHRRNAKRYVVYGIDNQDNHLDDDNNPPIIRYLDGQGRAWARSINDWHKSFSYLGRL